MFDRQTQIKNPVSGNGQGQIENEQTNMWGKWLVCDVFDGGRYHGEVTSLR